MCRFGTVLWLTGSQAWLGSARLLCPPWAVLPLEPQHTGKNARGVVVGGARGVAQACLGMWSPVRGPGQAFRPRRLCFKTATVEL